MEKYKLSDFKRDFVLGDQGEDVGKMQEILTLLGALFGFKIDQKELDEKRFGASTMKVAEQWREQYAKNPIVSLLADIVLQLVFHIDRDELNPELARGSSRAVRNYRDADDKELTALEASVWGAQGSTGRIVNMATKFVGLREQGENHGAVVRRFTGGAEGRSWCGDFVNYVMDHSVGGGIYDQKDHMSALSYMREGQEHGAFHKPQDGQAMKRGDVVVFTRGGGKGHVGIVTDIAADGTLTYVSGNDGNAVRERTFDINHPPKSLLGYTDTEALARTKGISIQHDNGQPGILAFRSSNIKIARHSDAAILRG